MTITHLDGSLLRSSILAATHRVLQMQEQLDNVNVFPVADADTGTNMSLTMRGVAEGALNCPATSIQEMSAALAATALTAAHGSSGAILAQFFQGLSEGMRGRKDADLASFTAACLYASRLAREAVSEPREGTILTVMQEWAEYMFKQKECARGFPALIRRSLRAASKSLSRTPEKLDVLKRAGVVDAGAQGFVYMLEGIVGFIQTGEVAPLMPQSQMPELIKARVAAAPLEITFQFCTQMQLVGTGIDLGLVKQRLRGYGDSLIVAGMGERVHIHIHTNEPEQVFTIAEEYGVLASYQKEDMRRQHTRVHDASGLETVALITDSSCDLPADEMIRHKIRIVPCLVMIGDTTYTDKVTLNEREFYRLLSSATLYPKTSQPTPAAFLDAYSRAAANHREALTLTISGNLSGTLQVAELAARNVKENIKINVVDSKNISAGLGLIVREAAEAIESGAKIEEVKQRVDWAIRNVRLFALIETTDYLVRGGRLSKFRGSLANLVNLKLILTLDADGRAQIVSKTLGAAGGRRRLLEIVKREAAGKYNLRFIVAHANTPETAAGYVEEIRNHFNSADISIVSVSPALGCHLGPGAISIVFLGDVSSAANASSDKGAKTP
jgi:DegV family protein with EDD domain